MLQRRSQLVLITMLALLIPALVLMARPFFTAFILAVLIATVTNPLCVSLSRRLDRPALAAFVTTIATVSLLALLVALVSFLLSGEISSAYGALSRRSLQEGGWPALVSSAVERVIDAIGAHVPVDKEAIRTQLMEWMRNADEFLVGSIRKAVGGVAAAITTALFATVFVYFLLRYGRRWLEWLVGVTQLEPRVAGRIIGTLQNSVVANVNGIFSVAIAQGLLLSLGFWLVGLGSPVLWGTVGGLASIVPMIGAVLVWAPVTIAYLVMGAYWKALVLGAWGALIVGSVDNIVRPIVVGTRDRLHPVLIGLAAMGGAFAFGALGILLGPLVVSFAVVLVKELQADSPAVGARAADRPDG